VTRQIVEVSLLAADASKQFGRAKAPQLPDAYAGDDAARA